jgi:large subunit ribosomal protein L32e
MADKRLLSVREEKKRKKPKFLRQETWKITKFKNNPTWRRSRGHSSKMRKKLKGNPPMPNVGYRGPKQVRGYHPKGLPEMLIHNVKDLEEIEGNVAVRIGKVGTKKKIEILKKTLEKDLTVVNPRIKFIKITSEEDMENNIEIKEYINQFILSKKLIDEERDEMKEKAEELGIVLQE